MIPCSGVQDGGCPAVVTHKLVANSADIFCRGGASLAEGIATWAHSCDLSGVTARQYRVLDIIEFLSRAVLVRSLGVYGHFRPSVGIFAGGEPLHLNVSAEKVISFQSLEEFLKVHFYSLFFSPFLAPPQIGQPALLWTHNMLSSSTPFRKKCLKFQLLFLPGMARESTAIRAKPARTFRMSFDEGAHRTASSVFLTVFGNAQAKHAFPDS